MGYGAAILNFCADLFTDTEGVFQFIITICYFLCLYVIPISNLEDLKFSSWAREEEGGGWFHPWIRTPGLDRRLTIYLVTHRGEMKQELKWKENLVHTRAEWCLCTSIYSTHYCLYTHSTYYFHYYTPHTTATTTLPTLLLPY